MEERYYSELLFAAVRGYAERIGKGICELSSEDEEEIVLYTYLDINGNFTGPFRLYSLNMKKYFTEENK